MLKPIHTICNNGGIATARISVHVIIEQLIFSNCNYHSLQNYPIGQTESFGGYNPRAISLTPLQSESVYLQLPLLAPH